MGSVDDTATGSYQLILGLFGDPESIGPARQRALEGLKSFSDVFPYDIAYRQSLADALNEAVPRRSAGGLPDDGQVWHASMTVVYRSQQNWQSARVSRFLKEIVQGDPRLMAFGGLLSYTLPHAGWECLAVNHAGQVLNMSWRETAPELTHIIGSDINAWGVGHTPEEVDALFGLIAKAPRVEHALSEVRSHLRARLVAEALPLAGKSRKVRF